MRKVPTDAERKLWAILRSRRLDGFKFRRQVPVGGYILDYFCAKDLLAVVSDGGQHVDAEGQNYDKTLALALKVLGIRILRCSNIDVLKYPDGVAQAILEALLSNPHPNPLPEYRERGKSQQ